MLHAEVCVQNAKEQIGASAVCIGLYVTMMGPAKASTKHGSLKQVKGLLNTLSIAGSLPLVLMNKLSIAIMNLDKQAKKDLKEKKTKGQQLSLTDA